MFFLSLCKVQSDVLKYAEDGLFTISLFQGPSEACLPPHTRRKPVKTLTNTNQHFTHVYNKYFAGKLILKCVNLTIKLGVFHSICLLLVLTMLTKKELSGSARQREVYV